MSPTRFARNILLVLFALVFAACSNAGLSPGGGASDSGSDAGETVEVKLATWAGVDEANELQEIIDSLNAESDTYRIVQESSPAEYWTKVQTTLAAGTAADIMWMDQDHLPDFASKDALLPIGDRIETDDRPATDLSDYFDSTIERYSYDGELYGLPWIAQPVMLYINLEALENAGYSEEEVNNWTWDDFRQACAGLTVDDNGNTANDADFDASNVDQYGFSLVPGWPPVQMWIWQAGGEVLSSDLTTSPIDSAEALEGAQFVADLINETKCTPQQSVISERGFGEMMKTGQVAMFMGGAADDFERTEGMRIKAFLLPQGPENRATWAWIGGMSINANTDHPDAAYDAFVDLTQAIHEWKVPAPRRSMATRDGIINALPYKEISADNIVANLEHMRAPQIFPGYSQWATVFGERFVDPLVRGNDSADNLAPNVRPLLEDVLSNQ